MQKVFSTGLVLMDDMESNQISATLTFDKTIDKDTAYDTASQVMEKIQKVDGVSKSRCNGWEHRGGSNVHGKFI